MDYRKKYKEIVGLIKKAYLYAQTDSTKAVLEEIFPELKESEDEKVRKEIVRFIQMEVEDEIVGNKWLAWLRKQGEQKPDKVEQKFNVGDWVVTSYGKVNQVVSIDKDGDGYTLDDGIYFSGSWCDMYHLWTIQDAKPGDILAFKNNICGIIICKSPTDYDTRSYCRFVSDYFMNKEESGWDSTLLVPATKEQRDLLFKKMNEAGYEWDAEKKELKKIEQKSHRLISAEAKEAMYGKPAWSEYDELVVKDIEEAITNYWHGQSQEDLLDWLKSLKQRIGG